MRNGGAAACVLSIVRIWKAVTRVLARLEFAIPELHRLHFFGALRKAFLKRRQSLEGHCLVIMKRMRGRSMHVCTRPYLNKKRD